MALADLVEALRSDAAGQRAAALAEAREHARRIRSESEAAAERARTASLSRAEREERDDARRAVARARLEASARMLGARARLLERVRRSLERRIERAATDPTYRDTLPDDLRAALARMPGGPVWAEVSEGLASALEDAAAGHDDVRVVPMPGAPVGYTLHGSGGSMEVDQTLSARLRVHWPRVAVRLMQEVDG